MNLKKSMILGCIILILLVVTIFARCEWKDIHPEKALNNFSKLVKKESFNDLSLTIYYVNPFILTPFPLSVEHLINSYAEEKNVIDGSILEEHIDLFSQISDDVLIPVEDESRINARIYYIFETKKNRKIFDVAMWGDDYNMFINGVGVKENDIFYDIVMPFLPKEAAKELKIYLNKGVMVEESANQSE